MAACTAGHHVTTLFGSVFFLGPVLVLALQDRSRTPLPDERHRRPVAFVGADRWPLVARRLRRILPAAGRAGVFGFHGLAGTTAVP